MGKLSSRAAGALTNVILAAIVLFVGTVCFLPSASAASGVSDEVYYEGYSEDGVSLMFNVYWGTQQVYGILDVLDEYGAKATFFIGGSWADDNVSCLREIVRRGHEIGSHGYFHRDQKGLSFEENRAEIADSMEFILKATGVGVTLFAPPSGAYDDMTVRAAKDCGCRVVLWSKDTVDWRDKDESLCYTRATEGVTGGDLILMHPMQHTLSALPRILQYYRDHDLSAITVGENLAAEKS